ncbi:hypothetical protein VVR12_00795 [Rothia sp. LK2588]|uniref:hypothetical protein n=1 Tax=Rothia sp. LK2588 TaxID=3114369 RepID=UPI0034CF26AE
MLGGATVEKVITEADELTSFEVLEDAKIHKLVLGAIETRGKGSVASNIIGEMVDGPDDL